MGVNAARARSRERELSGEIDPLRLLARERRRGGPSILLDGRGDAEDAWETRLALRTRRVRSPLANPAGALDLLERLVLERRVGGGTSATGVAALFAFEALDSAPPPSAGAPLLPPVALFEVDAAVRFPPGARPVLVVRGGSEFEASLSAIDDDSGPDSHGAATPVPAKSARVSLPRESFLRAVDRIRRHIVAGDLYQANLTTRFEIASIEDPLEIYRRVIRSTPAPRSAFVEFDGGALVSASPEVFLDAAADGRIRTLPIKGTRPRGEDADTDRRLLEDLLASAKDRAELVMIVDLERNDLGRVCVPGSVRLARPPGPRSYPTVHHLVAEVEGLLRPDVGPKALLEATFPGGSISGAPKLRALEILRALEPVNRGYYTGSLLWFGDDGSLESSILIRTIVIAGSVARIGAGGGIVADSDPEAEWQEASHKARGLTRTLGFEPEEAR